MNKNQLYLVLPIVSDNALDKEQVYLKVLNATSESQIFESTLKRVVTAFSWVECEDYVLYYDHKRFQDIFNKCSPEVQKQRPSPVQLLSILKQMTIISDKMDSVSINHVPFDKGIICGYVNQKGEGLVDDDALLDGEHLEVIDKDGNSVKLEILDCHCEEVFKWFVKNRASKRVPDPHYEKHGVKVKGEGKEAISARTYTDAEYQVMLAWAIGGSDARRKYYIDKEKGRLVVFCNENLAEPTYHYYDVAIDNPQEIMKMQQECGRKIVERIQKVFDLRFK